nr:hypothetical protein [uncultured Ruminococcus sp.]
MTVQNIKSFLTAIRSMVLKLLPAYKLFAGRKTETTTVKICEGTLKNDGSLTLLDDSFAGFVEGETYDVVLNGQSLKVTASQVNDGLIGIADLTDVANENGYAVALVNGSVVCQAVGTYIGAAILVSQTKTATTERYDIKKLPVECLPEAFPYFIPNEIKAVYTDASGYIDLTTNENIDADIVFVSPRASKFTPKIKNGKSYIVYSYSEKAIPVIDHEMTVAHLPSCIAITLYCRGRNNYIYTKELLTPSMLYNAECTYGSPNMYDALIKRNYFIPGQSQNGISFIDGTDTIRNIDCFIGYSGVRNKDYSRCVSFVQFGGIVQTDMFTGTLGSSVSQRISKITLADLYSEINICAYNSISNVSFPYVVKAIREDTIKESRKAFVLDVDPANNCITLMVKTANGNKGDKGDPGEKGDKGDSYTLTDADKQTITNAVLAALPTWTGGDF